eukprot:352517-Chlamydomonas_euryale.AAC.2
MQRWRRGRGGQTAAGPRSCVTPTRVGGISMPCPARALQRTAGCTARLYDASPRQTAFAAARTAPADALLAKCAADKAGARRRVAAWLRAGRRS